MRVINNPPSPVTALDKADLQAALDALALGGNRTPTFEQIRAALPGAKQARFTDGMIYQVIIEVGGALKVER